MGLMVVLVYALTAGVHDSQVGLGGGQALFGCVPITPERFCKILGHSLTFGVHQAEVIECCKLRINNGVCHGWKCFTL
jgi:hypothetical protein